MVLLLLARWLKKHRDVDARCLLIRGGELLPDFQSVCTTYRWDQPPPNERIRKQVVRKILRQPPPPHPQQLIEAEIRAFAPEIIYGNTVASHTMALHFKTLTSAMVVSHIHELDFSFGAYFADELKPEVLQRIDRFITVSEANRAALLKQAGMEAEKLNVVHAFIDVHAFSKPAVAAGTKKKELGLDGYFIVGGSGMPSWRKGFDVFIETAAAVSRSAGGKKIAFVWVGKVSAYDKSMLQYQMDRLGVTIPVVLSGHTTEPSSYFQDFDVFYLSSREDPFPLVCLEAAALEKPVICFERSGGMPEFVADDAGWILPYENTEAVAALVLQLENQREGLKGRGKAGAAKVARYDVEIAAPKIAALLGLDKK